MKKTAFLTLALVSAFAAAQSTDNNAYKAAHEKAEANYKAAKKQCDSMKGNAKDVCQEEAKVARAQADRDAVAQYKNTGNELNRAERKLADAKYDLAKEKCDDLSGDAKDSCQAQARSMKANAMASTTADGRTGVLVDNANRGTVAAGAADMRDRTAAAADRAGDRTAAAADRLGDKTAAATANARDKASDMAQSAKEKTSDATGSAKVAMSDTMITAKVKADMAADKTVKATDVHVETQQGVVMLSGFVPSKAEADRAVELAKGVQGVTDVKSSIQVKSK
ncbi:osmotically-inducible protein OsmY [Pseudoduganella flava]|uniref:Osmotically-inducible protein Y n=1 Tax=Pseudoduganella flava TaxID=871742 RepID=A0A562PSD2_9BURK|nr:BON domain-containing protein [Pseudoduganella flava]QGZ39367.1 BON domain-containing protein [Pseudoduganella flava]TWI47319.1 osmotically-inducible protein OsmY [Pseudoduganella flava]